MVFSDSLWVDVAAPAGIHGDHEGPARGQGQGAGEEVRQFGFSLGRTIVPAS
jgi:hypothetical protein